MANDVPSSAHVEDPGAGMRRAVYAILIAVGVGMMVGRILAVDSVDMYSLERYRRSQIEPELKRLEADLRKRGRSDPEIAAELKRVGTAREAQARLSRPFLSGNDRSRWITLRALVETEMRVEGAPYAIDKVIQQQGWDTIDMVKHDRRYVYPAEPLPDRKPGDRIKDWDGQQEGGHVYSSKPPLYPTVLAGIYWVIHKATGETLGTQPYFIGRLMLVIVHVLPMIVYFVLLARLIDRFGQSDWARVFGMSVAVFGTMLTTFAVVLNNHLPAAVCTAIALYASVRIWFDGERRLRYFAAAGLFAAMMVVNELPSLALAAPLGLVMLWKAPRATLLGFAPAVALVMAGFFGTNWIAHRSVLPPYTQRTAADGIYNYTYIREGRVLETYWNNPAAIDRGEENWGRYATHMLVGHHGVFSLTPVWLMTVAGLGIWLVRGDRPRRELAAMIAAVSLVCIAFYLFQPLVNRNYGGMTAGLRWLFWFAPLWVVGLLPAADWMVQRRWLRGVALAALAVSALSVSYPTWNPWTHPWLLNFMHYWGWL
jgi:hypothetical protein